MGRAEAQSTADNMTDSMEAQIQHTPLLSGDIIEQTAEHTLPQYGFLGEQTNLLPGSPESQLFLNTNVPLSAFICGVQGSGKSHTTSCFLENALIPSRDIGELKNPLSALVFSYGDFNSDGAGFSISEAAFLAAPHSKFPRHPCVMKITVLVSPSNPAIKKLYARIPNVTVMSFKIKPHTLDISTMLTLMAVDESSATPLYMAEVTRILRDINVKRNGVFDYNHFRKQLKKCDFTPSQLAMLTMRLDSLESFMDIDNTCPEPEFRSGEVTIMDMSCPFVDANTACILFKASRYRTVGLQRYLQSKVPGKMVVLDEAHKYMLKVPGAKALNDQLFRIIRLERHWGARVIISTQEPVLLTDLIPLCSIVVIHRFSSPEWFAALKKHIHMASHDHNELLRHIERLLTGHALIYSAKAILGRTETGTLVTGTGKLMEVKMRMRVTSDGGQSKMSVN
ncbi:hypothetical protein BCR34DRAFT_472244 [Clohesyomyces aquaticus]|uniref:P-loop containing nucleoside triphosphate hydrolase protein n=1 Tax=Clohesyomyces aquaticus TaxID=1231657 RepID=A0A1Y2A9F7_9PLEO|nr:hypothetical protein BCR34DRAFT_472244 [Clohesyomyces aquaticus]